MFSRWLLRLGLLAGMLAAPAPIKAAEPAWHGPEEVGHIEAPQVSEASGLACSRRTLDLFWTHNDSGGEPVLYAIDGAGRPHGSVRLNDVPNRDWEDIASFELDGRAYLIVGDVGDNYSHRTDCMLYVIAEPDFATLSPSRELRAEVAWRIPVHYPGGPRDCESVAVDVKEKAIYLISKRAKPPIVYRLPLIPTPGGMPVAARVGELHGIPAPDGLRGLFATMRSLPCGLDMTPDGRSAVVVTYGAVYVYGRAEGETWATAFAGQPLALADHGLPQAEGVCFTADAKAIFVTSEGHHARILRYTLGREP